MGYYIIEVDIDTLDWQYGPTGNIATSEGLYSSELASGGTISLEHDPLPNTANTLVPYILNLLASKGLKSVPVGQCLGDDPANWYRTSESQPVSVSSTASGTASSKTA